MSVDAKFANQLFKYSEERVPRYSKSHAVIPRMYVPEWKTDMKNRRLLMQNAEQGGIPRFEHDENLFFEKREQLFYNVEDRSRVDSKYKLPDRSTMLQPKFHHNTSRLQSSLMSRHEKDLA